MAIFKRLLIVSSLLFFTLLSSCGGGGGSSSSNDADQTQSVSTGVSENELLPGQPLTVFHNSISADSLVKIQFKSIDGKAEEQTLTAIAVRDNEVTFGVPPYMDADTGEISSGTMSIYLDNTLITSEVTISEPLALGFETSGTILLAVLELARDQYLATLDELAELKANDDSIDTSESIAAIESAISDTEEWIDEISFDGELSLDFDDSGVVLSAADLSELDRWLLLSLLSLDQLADDEFTRSLNAKSVLHATRTTPVNPLLKESWEEFKRVIGDNPTSNNIKDSIDRLFEGSLEKAKDGAVQGVTVLGAYISLLTAGTGKLGGEAIKGVAKALSQANAHSSALLGALTAWWANKNTDSLNSRDREEFDATTEFLSQLARWGTNTLGNFLPEAQGGNFFGNVNTGLTLKDLASTVETKICSFEISFFCDDSSSDTGDDSGDNTDSGSIGTYTIVSYLNFDGSTGTNLAAADIQLSGNSNYPTFSWTGDAIAVIVSHVINSGVEPNVFGVTGEYAGSVASLGSSIKYGDYSGNVDIVGQDPSPALVAGESYIVQVQLGNGQGASLFFTKN